MTTSRRAFVIHVLRVAVAVLISTATFVALVALDRTVLRPYPLLWFVWPLAIAAGYIPLWRWYPRNAYPIGLVFCPAMFLALWQIGTWLWPRG